MITIENVKKSYGQHTVLDGINLTIKLGEIVGLIGRNGSGKTTLMKCLMNVYSMNDGKVLYQDDIVSYYHRAPSMFYLIPDAIELSSSVTVRERFLHEQMYYPQIDEDKFSKWLTYLELDEKAVISQLSKGEQKAVHLGIALAIRPKLLLLDEFIDGIDIALRNRLWSGVKEAIKGKEMAVLIASHSIGELKEHCHRMLVLSKGQLIADKEYKRARQIHYVQVIHDEEVLFADTEKYRIKARVSLGKVYYYIVQGELESFMRLLKEVGTDKVLVLDDHMADQLLHLAQEVTRFEHE